MHWLTSGQDADALAVIRRSFTSQGGVWRETPMPGAGETGRTAAVNRILGGQPADIFQFSLGGKLTELAAAGLLAPVPADIDRTLLPSVVSAAATHAGRLVALPIDIRGENWLIYNSRLLARLGVPVPQTWAELLAAAQTIKRAGVTPLALGGQPWQERVLFNAILLGIGGPDFYRGVYSASSATTSPTLLRVFETFGALRAYVDEASPGRRWSQTTDLIARGQATFEIMGDWAKAELRASGATLGADVGCVLAPQNHAYIMNIDVFVFSPSDSARTRAGQSLFASTAWDGAIQAQLARDLGAIPARSDAPGPESDPCSTQARALIRDPRAQLMDPSISLPSGIAGEIDDAISQYWNDSRLSAAQGVELFRRAVAGAP